jgi:hypothetical protein
MVVDRVVVVAAEVDNFVRTSIKAKHSAMEVVGTNPLVQWVSCVCLPVGVQKARMS